jgi:succinate dehydrogenase / fumarate reductase membrane anchor subunit
MIDKATIANPKTHYGHGGTRHFVRQRVTGALNVLFLAFFVWFVVRLAGADRAAMLAEIKNPLVALALVLLIINVTVHMRLGMNEVIEDYVTNERLNRLSRFTNTAFAVLVAAATILSVAKILFWS